MSKPLSELIKKLPEEVNVSANFKAENMLSEMKKYELTKDFESIMVHHALSDDYLVHGHDSTENAKAYYAQLSAYTGCPMGCVKSYTALECLEAVEQGDAWPIKLGLVKDVSDEKRKP